VIVSNAEEATKSQHRISDFAAHLVETLSRVPVGSIKFFS